MHILDLISFFFLFVFLPWWHWQGGANFGSLCNLIGHCSPFFLPFGDTCAKLLFLSFLPFSVLLWKKKRWQKVCPTNKPFFFFSIFCHLVEKIDWISIWGMLSPFCPNQSHFGSWIRKTLHHLFSQSNQRHIKTMLDFCPSIFLSWMIFSKFIFSFRPTILSIFDASLFHLRDVKPQTNSDYCWPWPCWS